MTWDEGARLLNLYRVVPRVILIVYSTFFIHAWYYVVNWFMAFDWAKLPNDDIVGAASAAAVAGFPSVVLGMLTKVLKDLVVSYWGGQSSPVAKEDGE